MGTFAGLVLTSLLLFCSISMIVYNVDEITLSKDLIPMVILSGALLMLTTWAAYGTSIICRIKQLEFDDNNLYVKGLKGEKIISLEKIDSVSSTGVLPYHQIVLKDKVSYWDRIYFNPRLSRFMDLFKSRPIIINQLIETIENRKTFA